MTKNDVLDYVKSRLGAPYVPLEYSDEEILKVIQLKTIPLFSKYIPDKRIMAIDFDDPSIQTERNNVYILRDKDNAKILNVVDLIPDIGNLVIAGHPIIGLIAGNGYDVDQVANYLMRVNNSRTVMQFSQFDQTFQFMPPDRIQVLPKPTGIQACIYERQHLKDFSTIPAEFEHVFLDLCYADVALNLASIRKYYTNISTPFGEIQLNADALASEATEIRNGIIEQLSMANPSVIVDVY